NLGAAKGRGRFEDVTEASGLYQIAGPGLGVYCADFDGDGWPDIFVANDAHANYLWINQRNGTFVERGFAHGIAVDAMGQVLGNMGIAVGDLDGNGLFDLYVTHLTDERNTLWAQGPKRGQFRDRTALAGLFNSAWRGTGFGTVMVDFDNDGWLDLALVNGRVSRGPATHADAVAHLIPYCERNQLFRNEGGGQMRDISPANADFCGRPNVARGLAYGDFDGDGGVDLVLTTVAGPARIYRNIAAPRGHWLALRAIDPRLRRDAYGAEIRVRAGERQWLRILNPVDSFQSSSEPRAYFGLGEAAQFDGIEIVWPDGLVEEFPGGTADRRLVLRRGEGKAKGP
ncbi:MAG: CRTAC1 family protein, partial [Gemmataceae bacterium]|nr:CRTAC1 family protein [Gemmataceae bacterium]